MNVSFNHSDDAKTLLIPVNGASVKPSRAHQRNAPGLARGSFRLRYRKASHIPITYRRNKFTVYRQGDGIYMQEQVFYTQKLPTCENLINTNV